MRGPSPIIAIHTSKACEREKSYICDWVFTEVLGIEFEIHWVEGAEFTELTYGDSPERILASDAFFSRASKHWLSPASLPTCAVSHQFTIHSKSFRAVQFEFDPSEQPNNGIHKPIESIDYLGALFFLLSRYEECVTETVDSHGRFPGYASIPEKHSLVDRAVGNELIELLWAQMKSRWPHLSRKHRSFRILPSHDIDWPSLFASRTGWQLGRQLVSGVIRRRSLSSLLDVVRQPVRFAFQDYSKDPYNSVQWIMDQSEKHGLKSAFYYIPEKTHEKDPGVPLHHPVVVQQWIDIATRQHEIGLHPGYDTYLSPQRIRVGATMMRAQMNRLRISQEHLGGRQHFLRWKTPDTARHLNDAGLDYDSTLGYAEQPGFRCGVCYEYPMYDVDQRRPLRLRQRPLIAMDCSVMDERYQGLGVSADAFNLFSSLKEECRKYNGDFTLLWHNTHLLSEGQRDLYCSVLSC